MPKFAPSISALAGCALACALGRPALAVDDMKLGVKFGSAQSALPEGFELSDQNRVLVDMSWLRASPNQRVFDGALVGEGSHIIIRDASTDSDFPALEGVLTNGVPDFLGFRVQYFERPDGEPTIIEQVINSENGTFRDILEQDDIIDAAGYDITRAILFLDRVQFDETFGVFVAYSVEFWGRPIPTPGSMALFGMAGLIASRRWGRRSPA